MVEKMIKISVIIPCHNAQGYIRECLDSVLTQTLQDIEIICVDDGSTDDTFAILKEYENKNGKVRVRKQENQGAGIARNKGIDLAEGEYLAFVDADDFYPAEDILETMYNTAQQQAAEMCGGSICIYRNGVYSHDGWVNYTFAGDGWIKSEDFPTYAGFTRFIYKKKFIEDNGICFPSYSWAEDPVFFLKAIACVGSIYGIKKVTYAYRKGHKPDLFTRNGATDYIKGMWECWTISEKEGLKKICEEILNNLHGEMSALMYLFGENSQEIQYIIQQFNTVIATHTGDKSPIMPLVKGEDIPGYVETVRKEINLLLDELREEKAVLIYGAGTVGKMVLAFMEENQIPIEAFVVSDSRQNPAFIEGVPIRCIDQYSGEKRLDCTIVIATFPRLHDEIKSILQQKGFSKVYALSLEKFHLYRGKVIR